MPEPIKVDFNLRRVVKEDQPSSVSDSPEYMWYRLDIVNLACVYYNVVKRDMLTHAALLTAIAGTTFGSSAVLVEATLAEKINQVDYEELYAQLFKWEKDTQRN